MICLQNSEVSCSYEIVLQFPNLTGLSLSLNENVYNWVVMMGILKPRHFWKITSFDLTGDAILQSKVLGHTHTQNNNNNNNSNRTTTTKQTKNFTS